VTRAKGFENADGRRCSADGRKALNIESVVMVTFSKVLTVFSGYVHLRRICVHLRFHSFSHPPATP
jgi:hypothetical protein